MLSFALDPAELGGKVGTDAGRISRYEGGRITPSIDALMRIAEVFNVSADPPGNGRMSHSAWNFSSGPDDFYAATSFS